MKRKNNKHVTIIEEVGFNGKNIVKGYWACGCGASCTEQCAYLCENGGCDAGCTYNCQTQCAMSGHFANEQYANNFTNTNYSGQAVSNSLWMRDDEVNQVYPG